MSHHTPSPPRQPGEQSHADNQRQPSGQSHADNQRQPSGQSHADNQPQPSGQSSTDNRDDRRDIALFGATGLIGKLTAEYLATQAPPGISVSLAGRNEEKLQHLKNQLLTHYPHVLDWKLREAESFDDASLTALAREHRVVISTVGPYSRYGRQLVAACAANGTHYVDLCGEVLFMRESIDNNHAAAQRSGARIIHGCGFESVPSDMGMLLLHQKAKQLDAPLDSVTMLVAMRGATSGGTIDSMGEQISVARQNPELGELLAHPYALSPDMELEANLGRQPDYGVLRTEDVGSSEGWAGPFMMAGANARVVRRSNALSDHAYGKNLRYQEFLKTGRGVRGRLRAMAMTAGTGGLVQALKAPALGKVLNRWASDGAAGPSTADRENGFFRCQFYGFVAEEAPAAGYRRPNVVASVFSQGDPRYKSTSKMLAEAALTLVVDAADLPAFGGGVLTPATGLGMAYVTRLRNAGMKLTASVVAEDIGRDR